MKHELEKLLKYIQVNMPTQLAEIFSSRALNVLTNKIQKITNMHFMEKLTTITLMFYDTHHVEKTYLPVMIKKKYSPKL